MLAKVRDALEFVRFSHTIFALPFALASCLAAARGIPSLTLLVLIILAMVFARTAAMTFNRLADWEHDKLNPRTVRRHKLLDRNSAIALLIVSSAAFIATAAFINPLCLALSPVALAIVFFYSITKRFTSYSHVFLGLALSVSPVGAWLAVTGQFALPPMILALAVLLWVAGFDIIYATQDEAFDRSAGLHSLVVKLGLGSSLCVARWLHLVAFLLLLGFGLSAKLGIWYFILMTGVLAALVYEHRSICAGLDDVRRLNAAFFTSNAVVSALFLAATIAGLL
jgi:4-hydroxybenzoate polyprenyltransferase